MKLVIKQCAMGKGVFTEESIKRGTRVIEFTGPFLRQAETTMQTYALQIGPDLYIGPSGSYDDWINHCCEPNCGMIITGRKAELFAIRDIAAGEQISFDYSTVMAEEGWEMTCLCGSPACRKTIRTGRHLPAELKEKYLRLGMLPEYNR
jgi:SET domain-containing protein